MDEEKRFKFHKSLSIVVMLLPLLLMAMVYSIAMPIPIEDHLVSHVCLFGFIFLIFSRIHGYWVGINKRGLHFQTSLGIFSIKQNVFLHYIIEIKILLF
jgi:hypothetical protein